MKDNNKPKIFVVTPTPKGINNYLSLSPSLVSESYCAVINVADSPCATFDYQCNVPSFWFPIQEVGQWGYSPFYGALKVVNYYWKNDKPVLIHCHAGKNRSPSVAYAILRAKGYSPEEAAISLENEDINEMFDSNIRWRYIPSNIIEFLQECDTNEDSLHYILKKISIRNDIVK